MDNIAVQLKDSVKDGACVQKGTRNTMRDPYHWTSYQIMTQSMHTVTVKCIKICRLRSSGGGEKKT